MEKQKRDIYSKELKNKSELIRFVLGPDNYIFADLNEKLPGRGMWVQANKDALEEVISRKLFNKACHADCKISEDFIDSVKNMLAKTVLNSISLSKKTGDLTIGFEKTLDACKKTTPKVFLIASDSGEDGKNKFSRFINNEDVMVIDSFKASELQSVLGQDSLVVYGCINNSRISSKIIESYRKFLNFL